ncbi:MAG: AI-2E family transporter [Clostridia bacterium]|nr:AI-2E family transporter [Clostridia bacterium]
MSDDKKTTETTIVEERVEWLTRENIKKILLIALAIIIMLVFFQKIGVVFAGLKKLWDIIFPFVFGASLAFVVNVPMVQVENKFLGKKPFKGKRILAWFITLLFILAIIAGAMFIIIPQIVDTAKSVAANIQNLGSLSDIQAWIINKVPQTESLIAQADVSYKSLMSKAMEWIQKSGSQLLNSGMGVVSGVVSGVATFFIGFAFSVYVLFRKEALAVQGKKVLYALFPDHVNEKILKVCSLSYKTFSNFIRGQVLEACILGLMFFVTMTIFRMPYAMLCAVLIAITALIPIFGAFLGGGISTLLILTVSPKLALIFMAMFLVLQQIEGKLIYPHVVGSSVGLPGIWVLFAITVGGELLGVAGMLIFVPLCSVLYALFREFVYKRLAERQVPPEKWAIRPAKAARGEPIKVNTEKLQKLKERKSRAAAAADEAKDSIADTIEDGRDTPEE